jgi:hypothetical protein
MPASGAVRWRAIEHLEGQTPITVTVNGKSRIYFRILPARDFAAVVSGPTNLKVVTRAETSVQAAETVAYSVSVFDGATLLKEQKTESSVSERSAVLEGGPALCKSRTFTLAIPRGTHRIRLAVSGVPSVLVRLLVAGSKAAEKPPTVSMTPVEASRSVTLAEGEKLIPYYTVQPGRPVRWRIVGPTSFELTSRLDFDASMRGVQVYRLAIVEPGRPDREYEFKTTKTTTASYTDLGDRVASKLSRVVVPVGVGLHELSVELREPKSGSAELHARIPSPNPGGEE